MRTRWLFLLFLLAMIFSYHVQAQRPVPLPHGMIFGQKPDTSAAMDASKLRGYMGFKKRITIKLKGKILKVTKEKGGWFELAAGKGETINAHFRDYNVKLPTDIEGRIVILQGVAKRQFRAAEDQHFAGDTANHKTGELKRRISFEVKGLMVYQ